MMKSEAIEYVKKPVEEVRAAAQRLHRVGAAPLALQCGPSVLHGAAAVRARCAPAAAQWTSLVC